jgi:hypothetical protein
MSDYFSRLAARAVGAARLARPALGSRFEAGGLEIATTEEVPAPVHARREEVTPRAEPPVRAEAPVRRDEIVPQKRRVATPDPAPVEAARRREPEFVERREVVERISTAPPVAEPERSRPAAAPVVREVRAEVTREQEMVHERTIVMREERTHERVERRTAEHRETQRELVQEQLSSPERARPLTTSVVAPRPQVTPGRQTLREEPSQPPPVQITIGRVEVRPASPRVETPPAARRDPRGPALGLEQYLKEQG